MEQSIAINQPRASYFVGGAEVVSLAHAKTLLELGRKTIFYTLSPESIGQEYSSKFVELKEIGDKTPNLEIVELDQDPRALSIYSTVPGEDKNRWYTEAMFYNRPLYDTLASNTAPIDVLLSYYQYDALTIPSSKIRKNALYICGIPSTDNNLRRSQLMMYDQVFAINNQVKDYWQRYDERNIVTAPTGVDSTTIDVNSTRGKDNSSIVFAGRLIERKGCADLIQAAAGLPDTLKQSITLTILGEGPQEAVLKKLVADKGLESQVCFEGLVDEPQNHFSRADICVFPSRSGEGLMGVVLEAMSTGACVVSTYENGNEVILGGSQGVLYRPGDIEELRGILIDLLNNLPRRRDLGAAALKYVTENHNWKKRTAELFDMMS